ncbi:hypothetical protein KSP39_PZI002080 [Platanthera zijinensis]|uniref:Uncharacterized protein n=1 Tax=Platanthera zijinensis TaxID=2320716 RepID=A0AAP0BXF1_9ASPA
MAKRLNTLCSVVDSIEIGWKMHMLLFLILMALEGCFYEDGCYDGKDSRVVAGLAVRVVLLVLRAAAAVCFHLRVLRAIEDTSRTLNRKKTVAFRVEDIRKSREKTPPPKRDAESECLDPSSAGNELSDGELTLFSKQFKKMFNRRRQLKNKGSSSSSSRKPYSNLEKSKKEESRERSGNIIADCSVKSKEIKISSDKKHYKDKKIEKSFLAKKKISLLDSDSESSESEEEETYIGLISIKEKADLPRIIVSIRAPLFSIDSDYEDDEELNLMALT